MNKSATIYRIKEDSIGTIKLYLGENVKKWSLQDKIGISSERSATRSEIYDKEDICIVETLMQQYSLVYSSTTRHGSKSLFSSRKYKVELEATDFCSDDLTTVYQKLMGMIRWLCELVIVNLLYEASLVSAYMAQPRLGHLQQGPNMFHYLNIMSQQDG